MPETGNLVEITFANPRPIAIAFQRDRLVALPLCETVTRLRSEIEAAGLWVLHEIDPQMLLRKGGFKIPGARQILFFHARLMARLIEANSAAILEAPLKFALLEEDSGIRLRWLDPAAAFSRYENEALRELGHELSETCDRIADRMLASIAGTNLVRQFAAGVIHPERA